MDNQNPDQSPEAELVKLQAPVCYQTRFFSLNGRIGRTRFFAYIFSFAVLYFIALAILSTVLAVDIPVNYDILNWRNFISLTDLLIHLPLFFVIVVMTIRRLSDLNITHSFWLLGLLLIPMVQYVFLLCLILAWGNKGPNRFGLPEAKVSSTSNIVSIISVLVLIGLIAALALPGMDH
jgi:uncharacterized membrane protein YhaH (DUF805 family)